MELNHIDFLKSETVEQNTLINESLKELEFFALLDKLSKYCLTDAGKEIILSLRPTNNIKWLNQEHLLVEECIKIITEDAELPFGSISEIRPLLHKSMIQNSILSPTEILSILDGIKISRLIKGYLINRQDKYPQLFSEGELLFENRILEKHIEEAIDETGEIRDNATKELQRIRRSIFEKSNFLRSRLQKIVKRVSEEEMVQDDFYTMREGRFVIPIKSEHKRHIAGVIHGVSQTGSTVFLEPSEIFELNNELSLLSNEEKREIYKILSGLSSEIGKDANQFLYSFEIIAHFDSLFSKAKYALDFAGIKPIVSENSNISLINIRHPLLVHNKGKNKVIPLSIEFEIDKRGHLISGPNAGGKTVALKSIGINIAMALSGIYPLGECRTNYRTIFTSIGDHQSIENDLSTFSSQIFKIKEILSDCDSQSLVLIDEIGSGTDPQEGSALAAGILDTFIELNLYFIATTHQSSLKTYALTRPEILNASLEFDEKLLKPTYKFLSGIPGNSYAFPLAESIGLSKLVLERANKYRGERHTELEESISILQKYKTEAHNTLLNAQEEKLKAEKARINYENKFKEIKLKRQELMNEAHEEAFKIVNNANSIIENTIREIREDKIPITNIKQDFENKKNDLEKLVIKKYKQPEPELQKKSFDEGDTVRSKENFSIGTIIEIDKNTEQATVDFNGVKFKLSIQELSHAKDTKPKYSSNSEFIKFDSKLTLDIRGWRAEESIRETEDFISDALMADVEMINIIHGKGTGVLRKVIHDLLRNHPSVKSYRIGDLIEGGDGVTIVYL